MIPKKINKSMKNQLLKLIYKDYFIQYGYASRHINDYKIDSLNGSRFEKKIPSHLYPDILKELKIDGYIDRTTENGPYYISEFGYSYASKNILSRILDFLNNNSGLAIPISLVSLCISILVIILK